MSTKIEPIMSEEEMQSYVTENMHLVPKNQLKKFEALSLERKVNKIQFYLDMQQWRNDAVEKNKIVNRVKDVFEKRNATNADAEEVIKYCQEFIKNFRAREIAKLDEQIRQLELMKEQL